jgi:Trp operon repressor
MTRNTQWFRELCTLLAEAQTSEEVHAILDEILTPYESEAVAERLQIIKLLLAGHSQREVRDTLQVAIATVSRGARVLKYGHGTLEKRFGKTIN